MEEQLELLDFTRRFVSMSNELYTHQRLEMLTGGDYYRLEQSGKPNGASDYYHYFMPNSTLMMLLKIFYICSMLFKALSPITIVLYIICKLILVI